MMIRVALTVALIFPLFAALDAQAWDRTPARTFATLPDGAANPEGITADQEGNIYATLFSPTAPATAQGRFVVFSRRGDVLREVEVEGSSAQLLGLAFHPKSHKLLIADLGKQQVLAVDPYSGQSDVFTSLPASAGPNALTFDGAGNVYVSDSFGGIIYKIEPGGGAPTTWVQHALLQTTGVPPFGANGLAFNKARTALFVANTGNDMVVKIPVSNGIPGTPEEFTNSINGADGLIIDGDDNIWVAANQADEIVVVDPTGRAIAKLGDFNGIDKDGRPIGLLFPASLVFSGDFLYVTNLSLDLRLFGHATVDSQWAAQVSSHTIARIRAKIPPVRGLH